MVRVIIADDHAIFREGLTKLLKEVCDVEVVGTAKDGKEVVEKTQRLLPDIVIMDISMPILDGVQAAREIKRDFPHVKVILLTMHKSAQFAKCALLPEISGYVLKDEAFSELVSAIRAVSSNKSFISEAVLDKLDDLRKKKGEVSLLLTPRERQVLKAIAFGLTNRQIAKRLKISVKTVDAHRTNIMQKLDIHTTAELVRYAIEAGFLE